MAGKAIEAGSSFMAGVFAKISDPEKRAQAEAIFNDPSAADALVVVGAGALAQADINRKYAEIEEKETTLTEDYHKLNDWYKTKQTDLAEYERLKTAPPRGDQKPPVVDPNAPPPLDASKMVTRDQFDQTMREQQMAAANYLALQNVLTLKHYQDFGEVIDSRELLADKKLGGQKADGSVYGLIDAYQTKYSDKLTERDKKVEEARINKLADERVAERMKGIPNQPFPLKASPSPLDLLADPNVKPEQFTADAAAQEYLRLQEARQST